MFRRKKKKEQALKTEQPVQPPTALEQTAKPTGPAVEAVKPKAAPPLSRRNRTVVTYAGLKEILDQLVKDQREYRTAVAKRLELMSGHLRICQQMIVEFERDLVVVKGMTKATSKRMVKVERVVKQCETIEKRIRIAERQREIDHGGL